MAAPAISADVGCNDIGDQISRPFVNGPFCFISSDAQTATPLTRLQYSNRLETHRTCQASAQKEHWRYDEVHPPEKSFENRGTSGGETVTCLPAPQHRRHSYPRVRRRGSGRSRTSSQQLGHFNKRSVTLVAPLRHITPAGETYVDRGLVDAIELLLRQARKVRWRQQPAKNQSNLLRIATIAW